MKINTLAATLSAFTPGKMNGVNASANSSTSRTPASTRLRGRSLESKRFNMRNAGQRFATGYTPWGRHSRIAAISAMFENNATLGARKPV